MDFFFFNSNENVSVAIASIKREKNRIFIELNFTNTGNTNIIKWFSGDQSEKWIGFFCKVSFSNRKLVKNCCLRSVLLRKTRKILTEISKTPPKAVALASYLGDSYQQSLSRTSAKDLMAFGSVLQHNQHNIGMYFSFSRSNLIIINNNRSSANQLRNMFHSY